MGEAEGATKRGERARKESNQGDPHQGRSGAVDVGKIIKTFYFSQNDNHFNCDAHFSYGS